MGIILDSVSYLVCILLCSINFCKRSSEWIGEASSRNTLSLWNVVIPIWHSRQMLGTAMTMVTVLQCHNRVISCMLTSKLSSHAIGLRPTRCKVYDVNSFRQSLNQLFCIKSMLIVQINCRNMLHFIKLFFHHWCNSWMAVADADCCNGSEKV